MATIKRRQVNFAGRAAFIVGAICLMFGAHAIAAHNTAQALAERVAPVGQLNVVAGAAGHTAEAAEQGPADGAAVYNSGCAVCHAAGVAGAPKTGDAAVWQSRLAQGAAALIQHAIDGFQGETGVMPAKGGNPALRDDEVTAAVEYMLQQLP